MTEDARGLRHLVPAAALALALFVRWLLDPWLHDAWATPLVLGAVAAAVWYGGWAQAAMVALAGYLFTDFMFMATRGSLSIATTAGMLGFLLYSASSALIIALGHRARRERREARASARLLGRTLSGARVAAWEWDVTHDVLRMSENTPDLFGAGREFRPSRRLLAYIHPDDRQTHLRAVREAVRGGDKIDYGFRVVRPDGRVAWFESRGDVTRDASGRATLIRGIVIDVTERTLAQRALRETEQRLQIAQDLAPHGYAVLESVRAEGRIVDFRVAYINATGAALAKRSPEDLVGTRVLEVFPAVASSVLFERLQETCETGRGSDFEVHYPNGNGGTWFRYLLAKVDSSVATSFIDVTATKHLEEELRRRADALKEADRRKNEFLAVLAHELRNPLAPVATSLQILKRIGGDARTARTLDVMERQLAQIVHLIDDLLDISRIEQGKTTLHRSVVQLQDAVAQGIDTAEPHIRAKAHELAVEMTPVPLHVHADPMRIAQVVANLLNNSAKYTHSHGRIRLALRSEAGYAVITVADNGIGIPHDKLKSIFDLFVQVDRASDNSGGGLGLGLTLAKNLVEIHGGTIEAMSEGLGKGSTFVVRLPLVVEPALERRPRQDARAATAHPARRILVVDDNQDAAETLAQLLRLSGDEVRTTDNGEDALAIGPEFRPHVAILDLGMPDIDGYELAQRVRRQRWGSGVLLVALSGWGQEEDKARSRDAGFDHHLTKPVSPVDLEQVLEHYAAI
ncbi:MAG TPA: ATP-binding protein [Burkholderiales bacterium]|nr:ATP-binding protein [Burkholderiales bacterium]